MPAGNHSRLADDRELPLIEANRFTSEISRPGRRRRPALTRFGDTES